MVSTRGSQSALKLIHLAYLARVLVYTNFLYRSSFEKLQNGYKIKVGPWTKIYYNLIHNGYDCVFGLNVNLQTKSRKKKFRLFKGNSISPLTEIYLPKNFDSKTTKGPNDLLIFQTKLIYFIVDKGSKTFLFQWRRATSSVINSITNYLHVIGLKLVNYDLFSHYSWSMLLWIIIFLCVGHKTVGYCT